MLKQIASLLCSLFVPKRNVGGVDKTVYGIRHSALGIADFSRTIHVTDTAGLGSYSYIAPSDGMAWTYGTKVSFLGININDMDDDKWITLIRISTSSNLAAYLYVKKAIP